MSSHDDPSMQSARIAAALYGPTHKAVYLAKCHKLTLQELVRIITWQWQTPMAELDNNVRAAWADFIPELMKEPKPRPRCEWCNRPRKLQTYTHDDGGRVTVCAACMADSEIAHQFGQ